MPNDAHTVYLLPNAHIDVAWLWEIAETRREVVPNTFRDVLDVMDADPELTYTQSQALFYVWLEQDDPELLERIRRAVAEGRWELAGGAWVEPDANLPCGESLVRQHLLGQGTYQRLFGRHARVAWLPDTFGFNGNLPQILRHCGLDYFYTAKMLFNVFCRSLDAPAGEPFPLQGFRWEGIDGSRVLSYCSPLFYNTVLSSHWLEEHSEKRHDAPPVSLLPFGRGDHGGGPTAAELSVARAWRERLEQSGSPEQLVVATAEQFFLALEEHQDALPVHRGELYLENHRGCATTEGRIKRQNRELGHRLTGVEKLLSGRRLAGLSQEPWPAAELRPLWEDYLTNQFHDIICGSSISAVHEQAVADYAAIAAGLGALERSELGGADYGARIVFNSLSWPRRGWTTIPIPGAVIHHEWQLTALEEDAGRFLVPLPEVPGLGAVRVEVDLARAPQRPGLEDAVARAQGEGVVLENEHLKVTVSCKTGNLSSVFAKALGRELLSGEGNCLQLLSDARDIPHLRHQFSAWNVAYEPETREVDPPESVKILEEGPLRAAVRIERTSSASSFVQEVFLRRGDPVLHCRLHVDWRETYTMLKVLFPVAATAREATYEIPFGAVSRPTHTDTTRAEAQFENATLQWIDLTDAGGEFGAALLNAGKQGGDVRGDRMRLTLLRSSMYPAPDCDKGHHSIAWGFFPHAGTWSEGGVVEQAYDFNDPLREWTTGAEPWDPPLWVEPPGVILSALKRAEDGEGWVLRLYESRGRRTTARVRFAEPPAALWRSDGLERAGETLSLTGDRLALELGPFEIASLRFE